MCIRLNSWKNVIKGRQSMIDFNVTHTQPLPTAAIIAGGLSSPPDVFVKVFIYFLFSFRNLSNPPSLSHFWPAAATVNLLPASIHKLPSLAFTGIKVV
ncbi:hypothetical protein LWI28_016340 [Acer negundo]|uniref:Uncharacterized protein n=1 Tax=Acer negundo TaxID=4023 RepID=A0AAD5I6G0_ACENE|nr:hypothetical protein LWI28_016340 [Acer negundo]